jgi:hypothetical protein
VPLVSVIVLSAAAVAFEDERLGLLVAGIVSSINGEEHMILSPAL